MGHKQILAQRYQAFYETIMQIIVHEDSIRRDRLALEGTNPPDENIKITLTNLYAANNTLRQRMNELQTLLGKDRSDLWETIGLIIILFPDINIQMDVFTPIKNIDHALDEFLQNDLENHPQWATTQAKDDWRKTITTNLRERIKTAIENPIDSVLELVYGKIN